MQTESTSVEEKILKNQQQLTTISTLMNNHDIALRQLRIESSEIQQTLKQMELYSPDSEFDILQSTLLKVQPTLHQVNDYCQKLDAQLSTEFYPEQHKAKQLYQQMSSSADNLQLNVDGQSSQFDADLKRLEDTFTACKNIINEEKAEQQLCITRRQIEALQQSIQQTIAHYDKK